MKRPWIIALTGVALLFLCSGCALTRFRASGQVPVQPVCQPADARQSALVLWGPVWRPDQKEVPQREAAAQQGIEGFFADGNCFASAQVRRLPGDRQAQPPSDDQMRALAVQGDPPPDRVVVILVRELGPVIQILGPIAAFGGGTMVELDLVSLDARNRSAPARFSIHWHNGGSLVFKGVATLPHDMTESLHQALRLEAPAELR